MSADVNVRLASIQDKEIWNAFVTSFSPTFVFYDFEWGVLFKRSFKGFDEYYLMAMNNQVEGVFPIFYKKLGCFRLFFSLPFEFQGEPLTRSPQVYGCLISKLEELASEKKATLISISTRDLSMRDLLRSKGYVLMREYLTSIIDLRQPLEIVRQKYKKGARWAVRAAEKRGVEIRDMKSSNDLEKIYRIYVENMKRVPHGAALFPYDLFLNVNRSKNGKFFISTFKGEIIGALALLYSRVTNSVEYFINCSEKKYLSLRPNNLLMDSAIAWAKGEGFAMFNLGKSFSPSLHRYKESWGGESRRFYVFHKGASKMHRRMWKMVYGIYHYSKNRLPNELIRRIVG